MSAPSFEIVNFTGPMLLGHLFNYALLGVVAIQVYVYTLAFPRDHITIKALVYFVFFLDLLQTGFATHYAWYVLAAGWGNPLVLELTPWTLATVSPLSATVSLLVQSFYLWRIWVLSNGRKIFMPLFAIIAITALGSCVAAWYSGILSASLGEISKASVLDREVTAWLAGAMACDVLITITLVGQLAVRRNTGFVSTNRLVHRAMRMAIETGALTSVIVTTELALYLNSSTTTWYFLLGMLITKIYSNSLLASLNSRSPAFNGDRSTTTTLWLETPGGPGNSSTLSAALRPAQATSDIELGNAKTSLGPFEAKAGLFTSSGGRFQE